MSEHNPKRRRFLFLLSAAALGLVLCPRLSLAAPSGDEASKAWSQLSEQEKAQAQANFKTFQALPGKDQEELRRALSYYQQLSAEKKKEISENFQVWKAMNEADRVKLRQRFAKWKSLPPAARDLLQDTSKKWNSMTEEQKKQLIDGVAPKAAK